MQANKCPTSDQLNEFVTGKLELEVHNAIEQHLDDCASCQDTIEILDENSGTLLTGLKGAAEPAANDDPDLQQLVERAKTLGSGLSPQGGIASQRKWTSSEPQFATGTQLGNYVLGEPVGGGNMGFVYKAYHIRMKREVALKFISPQLVQSQDARRRFQREIEAAAKLNHPNVVAAYDADEVDGYYFLVQELITGCDLREVVKRSGPLSLGQALRYVLHATRGLEYAHDAGVVHRDIKPSNLLLDERDVVRVADFGLARLEHSIDESDGDELSRTGLVAGTPAYMSPEQCIDLRQTDRRTDIYSLGCTLFYLLTGQHVYQIRGGSAALPAHRQRQNPSIRELLPDCPVEVDRLYQSMLAERPEDRPQSMSAVAQEIERLLAKYENGAFVAKPRSDIESHSRIVVALAVGAVALVAVLLLGLFAPTLFKKTDDPTVNAKQPDDESNLPANIPLKIELLRIDPGKFKMGSPAEDSAARSDEKPQHDVEITKPFLLGKFEITVAQFTDVMGTDEHQIQSDPPILPHSHTPSLGHSPDPGRLPISGISWLEAVQFCNQLSERHGLTPFYEFDDKNVSVRRGSNGFRLPTEAEWEFACRAKSQTLWHFGDDPKKLGDYAWYAENSDGSVHPVGTKQPNAFGLHDMHGNAPEWCWDRFDPDYYAESEAIDPPGSSRGQQRVFRGGSAKHRASQLRSAVRNPLGATYGSLNNVGLRVARSID